MGAVTRRDAFETITLFRRYTVSALASRKQAGPLDRRAPAIPCNGKQAVPTLRCKRSSIRSHARARHPDSAAL